MKLFMVQMHNHLICSTHAFWQVSQYIGKVWSDHWLFSQFDSSRSILMMIFKSSCYFGRYDIFGENSHQMRYICVLCIVYIKFLFNHIFFCCISIHQRFFSFYAFFPIYYNSFHFNRKLLISIIWIFNYVSL